MAKRQTMTEKELEALQMVLNYLYEEEKDYNVSYPEDRERHIYNHISVLWDFLEWQG